MTSPNATSPVLRGADAQHVQIVDFSARLLVEAARSAGAVSLVEHVIAPRSLGAPVHTHEREDEYTYVVEGRLSLELDGELLEAAVGDVVFKPRGIPHAMWNATSEPVRMLELIVPGGMEQYFVELAELMPPALDAPDIPKLLDLAARYGIDMDVASIGRLSMQHGLGMPPDA